MTEMATSFKNVVPIIIASLKACGNRKDMERATCIHGDILARGLLEKDTSLGNTLVSVYAKCGELTRAHQVFEQLRVRDVISWNALISGYAQGGRSAEALNCFEQMRLEGLSASSVTYICALKACGSTREIERGETIHAEIVTKGLLRKHVAVGNALVDMYAKCGDLEKAREVFNKIPARNIVSWNALITGHVDHGCGEEVLQYFERMQCDGFSPNKVTFLCVLKACGSSGVARQGMEIHAEIARNRLLEKDSLVVTALVDMYAKCGALLQAHEVFHTLRVRDRVSWNAIISGYAQHGQAKEALSCFERMQRERVSPDAATFVCVLKSCGAIGALERGEEIHAEIVKQRLQDDASIGAALVDMYAKCDAFVRAQEVFGRLRSRSTVCWNSLLAGHAHRGQVEEALNCLEQMRKDGISADTVTFLSLLKACGNKGALDKGKEVHAKIVEEGILVGDEILVMNAVVDMYAKCGAVARAREVFDELDAQTIVSWNALIAGYAQHGPCKEVLSCYERMRKKGFSPDALTFASVLKACGSLGAIDKGEEAHADILKEELQGDALVGNALVGMYAKCGAPAKARKVFDELPVRDVVAWTALISGYSQIGHDELVTDLFNRMVSEGVKPDLVACTIVLNACSRSGLLDRGELYFEAMSSSYGIAPTVDHCTCMLDMFGRAGQFGKVLSVVEKLPSPDHLPFWATLLGACHKWGNVELGRLAFERVVQLDEKHCAAYVLMSNIYASAGMEGEAQAIEALRAKRAEAWE